MLHKYLLIACMATACLYTSLQPLLYHLNSLWLLHVIICISLYFKWYKTISCVYFSFALFMFFDITVKFLTFALMFDLVFQVGESPSRFVSFVMKILSLCVHLMEISDDPLAHKVGTRCIERL